MTTASDTLAQLEELWESAESAQPQVGDAYIRRAVRDEISYEVGVAERPILSRDYRILERAKPKAPEWEAVVASGLHYETHKREVYFRNTYGVWESESGIIAADDLVDPVPLVEMPSREDLLAAFEEAWDAWMRDEEALGGADGHRSDAVLKLLERR